MTNVENVIDPDNGQNKNKIKYFKGKNTIFNEKWTK